MVGSATRRDVLSFVAVVSLLIAVSVLPPDTSLREAEKAMSLKACVPPVYPPLVTGDPERPGIDIELLRAVAERMGLSLVLNENPAMGNDFNPRNWRLNRAQCQVIAGGVVDSMQTRSFLDVSPSYAETGWAVISKAPIEGLDGQTVGVLTLISGLDRIGLASFLREGGATARVVASPDALVAGISEGVFDAGVTEAMLATKLAGENGWTVAWAPPGLARYRLIFGLWKGDVTLKHAIERAFAELSDDGTLGAILDRYGSTPVD